MSINKKLLQYADFKDISQRKFTLSLGLSEGVLRKGRNIGSGYLKVIKENYHDLNMNWLLFDEGEMLLSSENIGNKSSEVYGLNYRDKYIDVLEENRELNKKMNLLKESNERLKKLDNHVSV